MANVGSFGEVAFYCRASKQQNEILSFHDLQKNSSASFAEHERNGLKPYLEYNGEGLDELSLVVEADARYGVRPLEVQEKLYAMKETGQAEAFVLGGQRVGNNPFVITGISEVFKTLYVDGRPIALSFQMTLKEYANQTAQINIIPADRQLGSAALVTGSENYTVVKGDCLWNIAKKFYGSGAQYTKIYNENKDKIKNPNLIYPGQVLIIPK